MTRRRTRAARAPRRGGGLALGALVLSLPLALAAAIAALIAGGGILAALLAYSLASSLIVLAAAALSVLPRRLPAPARAALDRFARLGQARARPSEG